MAKKKERAPNGVPHGRNESVQESPKQVDDSGEYGLEQILRPAEADLEEARKHSAYHYSRRQLDHKEDRVTKKAD